jgi:hypothetical protein
VRIDGTRVSDAGQIVPVQDGTTLQVGKRKFVKLGR